MLSIPYNSLSICIYTHVLDAHFHTIKFGRGIHCPSIMDVPNTITTLKQV